MMLQDHHRLERGEVALPTSSSIRYLPVPTLFSFDGLTTIAPFSSAKFPVQDPF